jgi:hypothetical protein
VLDPASPAGGTKFQSGDVKVRLRDPLVVLYVEQHNSVMPHFAFDGQTPDEMYFGTGVAVPAALAEAHARARTERIEVNRKLQCASCGPPPDQPAPAPDPLEKP